MTGTFINIAAVLVGSALGITLGRRLNQKIHETIVHGLGLVVLMLGMQMALGTANPLIPLGSIAVGGILGEWWDIEGSLKRLGGWLETRFNRAGAGAKDDAANRFSRGFVMTSLLFCVGPLTILGSIQDGLSGDYRLLAVKSMLDGFASLAFSASLGIGVAFSALTVLVVQGTLTLLASQANAVLTSPMIKELTAAGGVIILGLSISSLLEIKPIRVANFLPALVLAPLIVWVLTALGLPIAPQF
jgi:hypothetical protein